MPAIAETIAELRAIEGPLLLITSRERLQLQGEHVYPVPAMDQGDGVDLFVERARQLDPGFEDTAGVGELCERLDRLPLALELAAARTSLYTPAQLLERLGDRLDLLKAGRDSDPRQQTLRATIDWSYELLTAEEQRVYRAFSVFAGGCSLEAAEEVCGADPDTLASLLDKSLLRRRDASSGRRYWMLETIREHAAEHLARLGERDSLEASHAGLYVQLAEDAYRQITTLGVDETVWFDRLLDERDNLRTALSYHRDRGNARELARVCAAIWFVWFFRGDAREGRQWLQTALEQGPPDELRAAVENALAALILTTSGDAETEQALELARAAVDHARAQHDPPGEAAALITVGNILVEADPAGARDAWLSARRLAADNGELWWQLTATFVLAQGAAKRGNWSEAAAELEACRALIDEHGHGSIHSISTMAAEVEWQLGNVEAARRHLAGALGEAQQNPLYAAYGELTLAAEIAVHDGALEHAVRLVSAAQTLLAELGVVEDESDIRRSARIEALARETLGEEAFTAARERGHTLTLDEAVGLALDRTGPSPDRSGSRASH